MDEIPSAELVRELLERQRSLQQGRCPYCHVVLKKGGLPVGPIPITSLAPEGLVCVCRFGKVDEYHPGGVLWPVGRLFV